MARYFIVGTIVTVENAILHCQYRVGRRYYSTRVRGCATHILAGRFRCGESLAEIASDTDLDLYEVEEALRWELRPRRTRVRMVERAIKRDPVE